MMVTAVHHFAFIKPAWDFPVTLQWGDRRVPIHAVCDLLAYTLGFRLYLQLRGRQKRDLLSPEQNGWIFVGCIFGALIGSKLLAWAEAPGLHWALRNDPNFWFGGKTIVGGLLGGWAGIEIAKKLMRVTESTGDTCVYPLILGMCIGRVGCFLTGLTDNTCGVKTNFPWGVDFGDGIPRHPAQIYEIIFLLALGVALRFWRASHRISGMRFRWFMIGYLSFRFYIDFFKPHWTIFAGSSGIQWGCLAGLLVSSYSLMKLSERAEGGNLHG